MESVMQTEKKCFLCGRNGNGDPLEAHHCFGGANRKLSEKYGLKVWLCGNRCHRNGPDSVHINKMVRKNVQAAAQTKYEELYGNRETFHKEFLRSYL